MLKSLYVRNYLLIDELNIPFHEGLTVITGETGAGKSILLDAIGLLLGNRAEQTMMRDTSQKCVVEGLFSNIPEEINTILEENNIDIDEELIIRREILPGGKTRSFINDTPVKLHLLKDVGELLMDIHSQHQTLFLTHPDFQIRLLDLLTQQHDEVRKYQQEFQQWKNLLRNIEILQKQQTQHSADADYLHFLLDELSAANLSSEEYEKLEKTIQMLEQKEQILAELSELTYHLVEKDDSVLAFFNKAIQSVQHLVAIFPHLHEELRRLQNMQIELKDFNYTVTKLLTDIEADPAQLENLRQRLHEYDRLLFKHKKKNVEELLEFKHELEVKLREAESNQEQIEKLQAEAQFLQARLVEQAKKLSNKRREAKEILEKNIGDALKKLGMPKARFAVQIEPRQELSKLGMDEVVFLFDANDTNKLLPLSQVASGGETSRLMLALKAQISSFSVLPTIIFDEIDTGISGEVAARVGDMLLGLSKYHQIITITHLPQIAARGQWHIEVSKDQRKAVSTFLYVSGEARVDAIARLLADKHLSTKTKEMAKELLNHSNYEL